MNPGQKPDTPGSRGWPWRLGQAMQGLVMGILLVAAIVGLLSIAGNVGVFVYQGY